MRKALFERQDDIEAQRNALIEQLEGQLEQKVAEKQLFICRVGDYLTDRLSGEKTAYPVLVCSVAFQ